MRILYSSCHQVLEWLEVSLINELGYDIFSAGAYSNPEGHHLLHRPGIDGAPYYPEYERIVREYPRTGLPSEFLEKFDVIIVMHTPEVLIENWPRMKHKKVIWRSIGQSVPWIERALKPLKDDGLMVVRYSSMESKIPDFMGADKMIRFYQDENEMKGWTGNVKSVINFTQSLRARGSSCYHDIILESMSGFNGRVFGPGNDDLGSMNGGSIPYELQKGQLRDNRVYLNAGTWPACYTLSFIEAFMTGIPIVSISKQMSQAGQAIPEMEFYEVPEIIVHGESGFVGNNTQEIQSYIKMLINDQKLAKKISKAARDKAIEYFGKEKIKKQWDELLKSLK